MKKITCYSYKGGVGRSLLVANFAQFLCAIGQKVFVLDMDLEAPGLHYKFSKTPTGGVVDYVHHCLTKGQPPKALESYWIDVTSPSEAKGHGWIRLMPAGSAPELPYLEKLPEVLGAQFGTESGDLSTIIEQLIAAIERAEAPDFLLIDSRTGLTEIARITTDAIQPDMIVCPFLINDENVTGAGAVMRALQAGPARVVPVVSRFPVCPPEEEVALLESHRHRLYGKKSGAPEVLPLREDASLYSMDQVLWSSKSSLFESVLLYDYIALFRDLVPEEFERSKFKALMKLMPDKEQVYRWRIWHNPEATRSPSATTSSLTQRIADRLATAKETGKKASFEWVKCHYIPDERFKEFTEDMAVRISQSFKAGTRLPPQEKDREDVNYDLLGLQMRYGIFDFCAEGYFLTATRAQFASVVQFGWLKTFGCATRPGSKIHKLVEKLAAKETRFESLFEQLFKEFPQELKVGLFGESAATSAAAPHVTRFLQGSARLATGDQGSLVAWLKDRDEHKIVFADHSIVRELQAELGKLDPDWARPGKEHHFTFGDEVGSSKDGDGVPVGFMYPRGDTDARKRISQAFTEALDEVGKAGWEAMAEGFKKVNIAPFGYGEMRSYLMMDMSIEEALAWRQKSEH